MARVRAPWWRRLFAGLRRVRARPVAVTPLEFDSWCTWPNCACRECAPRPKVLVAHAVADVPILGTTSALPRT